MSEHSNIDRKSPSSRRLTVAPELQLPRTLIELAGESNIDGGLRKKLGEDALWLLTDEVYAYADIGDTIYTDHFDDADDIPIPVRYNGLKELHDGSREAESYRGIPYEQLASFTVDGPALRDVEQYFEHAVYDYPEVAIRLGQAAAILELYEFNPRIAEWHRTGRRPLLVRTRYGHRRRR